MVPVLAFLLGVITWKPASRKSTYWAAISGLEVQSTMAGLIRNDSLTFCWIWAKSNLSSEFSSSSFQFCRSIPSQFRYIFLEFARPTTRRPIPCCLRIGCCLLIWLSRAPPTPPRPIRIRSTYWVELKKLWWHALMAFLTLLAMITAEIDLSDDPWAIAATLMLVWAKALKNLAATPRDFFIPSPTTVIIAISVLISISSSRPSLISSSNSSFRAFRQFSLSTL